MKKIIILATLTIVALTSISYAKDVMLDEKISSISVHVDKNGQEYTRLFITEQKSLNGIRYEVQTPLLVFGDALNEKVATLKEGSTIKCIANKKSYNGNPSYTLRALVK